MAQPAFTPDPLAAADRRLEALARLEALSKEGAVAHQRRKSDRLVKLAMKAWQNGDPVQTAKIALRATELDPTYARAFHVLGAALQRMGYTHKALVTYEHAYKLDPGDPEILVDIGLCAWNLKMHDAAKKLFGAYITARPEAPLGYNNLATIMADTGDLDGAIEVVRGALLRMPQQSILWHALGTMLAEAGRVEEALVFYREALRLEPANPKFLHNYGYALLHQGLLPEALDCYEKSLAATLDPFDRAEARHSRGVCLMGMGRLEEGFTDYEARLDPKFREYLPYVVKAPMWQGEPLDGKELLAIGEQGLGDEIMFANTLPDLQRAVGPDGHLQIAVDARLVSLFRRSFPKAEIGISHDRRFFHAEGSHPARFADFGGKESTPDFYVPIASTLHILRKRIEDFPHQPVLKPDPERVAHYREMLKGEMPVIGICWRSMMINVRRAKYYTTLSAWQPILKTPGVRFINLQYGDCAKELEEAVAAHGVPIRVIEGLDLKNDIEGAAALSAAVDLVISAPTAAAAIAGAVGTEVWFLTACDTWPQLGTKEYPWYRKTRAFVPERFGDWASLLPKVADELAAWIPR